LYLLYTSALVMCAFKMTNQQRHANGEPNEENKLLAKSLVNSTITSNHFLILQSFIVKTSV